MGPRLKLAEDVEGPVSRAAVCNDLRQRIVQGEYAAGLRLTEEQLAAHYRVSRMSVREALRLLAAEGFVRVQPYFGTFVAEMTLKQATDLLEVQSALEPLAAGLAARRRRWDHVDELKVLVERGRQAVAEGRFDEAAALHGEFHAVLARASGNDSLSVLMADLRDKLDWAYATRVRRPPGVPWDEHDEIVSAIEDGDPRRSVAAAERHMQHGRDRRPPEGR